MKEIHTDGEEREADVELSVLGDEWLERCTGGGLPDVM